jgi:hypothetical protein
MVTTPARVHAHRPESTVGFVIEPEDPWKNSVDLDCHDQYPHPAAARVRSNAAVPKRSFAPRAGWTAATVCLAVTAAVLVAGPTDRPVPADQPERSRSTSEPTDPAPSTPEALILDSVRAAACRYLFDIAPQALRKERDTYVNAVLLISVTEGRTLNEVVHDDLLLARDAVIRLPVHMSGGSGTRLQELDIAVDRADTAPCSLLRPANIPPS